jgi:hypothetical protein
LPPSLDLSVCHGSDEGTTTRNTTRVLFPLRPILQFEFGILCQRAGVGV